MDGYDDDMGFGGPVLIQQDSTPSEEEILYKELIGYYQACPDSSGIYNTTDLSDSFDRIITTLVSRGHKQYDALRYKPHDNPNGIKYIDYATIKMKMLAVTQRMATEFQLGDANYAIYHETPKANTHFHNTNNLSNTQSQSQQQEQSQSVEQLIEKATQQISESYGEKEASEAKQQLDKLKADKKWETVKSVVGWTANLGKDAFIAAIPAIMKAILHQP